MVLNYVELEIFFHLIYSYGSASFALSGLMKNVLKNRNTQFNLDEVNRKCRINFPFTFVYLTFRQHFDRLNLF